MKLRINLLSPELIPVPARLTLNRAALSWLLLLLTLLALLFYSQGQATQLEQQRVLLSARQDQLKLQHQALLDALSARKPSQQLQLALVEKQQELSIKKRLIKEIEQGAKPEDARYSTLLTDLAKVHQNQLWLSQIDVVGQNVALAGYTTDVELIPLWLQLVGQQGYLKGQKFGHLTITEQPPVHLFQIKTQRLESEPPQAQALALKIEGDQP